MVYMEIAMQHLLTEKKLQYKNVLDSKNKKEATNV